ncbi:UNVERIFIED_CONTAM: Transcription factor DIVARICATA [Sesamum radiatum]|uniref:Transcription factor DIVARICATA n=1 Tax=Sesamum radiatum TaxID=300843 RepID=A0AAW2KA12_SESRA
MEEGLPSSGDVDRLTGPSSRRVEFSSRTDESTVPGGPSSSRSPTPRDEKRKRKRKRVKSKPWTKHEHRLFIMGMEKYGKGDWKNISKNAVVTRSPIQVAFHAQRYFQSAESKGKRVAGVEDITTSMHSFSL